MDCVLGFYMKSPLEAWKGIDSEVHRMYMKKTKTWPKEKIVKTGRKFDWAACIFGGFAIASITDSFFQAAPLIFLGASSTAPTKIQLDNFLDENEHDVGEKVENPLFYYSFKSALL